MKKLFFKFWPIIFIFAIWFIFSSPYFIKNKVPFASTYQVNHFAPWDTYEKFWGPVKNGAMPDVIDQIYPWRHLTIEIWKEGIVPLWNPYSFSGTPHLANYQSAVLSPFNILFFILPFVDAWSILVLLQPLLAGAFMYLLMRSLKRSQIGSLVASVSFMFCGFITTWMGYATLGFAILFLPLAIFGIEKYHKTQQPKYLFLLSLSIPLSFFSGHFQISIYFLLGIIVYIIYKLFTTHNILNTLYLALFACFGLLLSMPQILPSIEFYTQSLRSSLFAKGEVIPWQYLPTFLSPDFFGNPVTRNDWFGHYAEWNAYIGVIPLMLAIYAVLSKKNTQTLFLFFCGIIALLLSFNGPILDFFINLHIPVLSTSSASRIIVLFSFVFAILSGFGYDHLIKDIKDGKIGSVAIWLSIFSAMFTILWIVVGLKMFMSLDKIEIARRNSILPTFIFFVVGFIIFLYIVSVKYKINYKLLSTITPFVIAILVAFDALRFSIKWQAFDPKNLVFPDVSTTNAFSKIAGYERVIGNFGSEASVYYHLPSLEGYDALYIRRYGEFVGALNSGKVNDSYRSVVAFPKNGRYASKSIDLLNVKYIVHKLADDHAGWTFPFWIYPKGQFKLTYKDSKYEFYENTKVMPRAFLVGKYKVIRDSQKIIDLMFDKDFDLSKEIILEEDPGVKSKSDNVGSSKVDKYTSSKIDISVDAKDSGLLFISDVYYKGWRAEVDGINTPIYRADYAFRAIPISAGKHEVKFIYDPLSFRFGLYLAVLGLMGALVTFLVPKFLSRLVLIFL